MLSRIAIALLLTCGLALAAPTTRSGRRPASMPTTSPAVKAPVGPLTPEDLAARIAAIKQKQQEELQIAYIALDKPISEAPPEFVLLEDTSITLHSVLDRLHKARDDKDVRAVLITLGDTAVNLSQAQEIRDALVQIRNAGKRSFVYADGYDTAAYIMASGATDICMLGGGEIMIPGVGLETMFAKGLLDKVGVKADYVQIGEYKGADEMYTRTEASKELRGELNKLVGNLYTQIVDNIAFHRRLAPSKVEEIIDQTIVTGEVASKNGLVDHLVDIDGLRDLIKKELDKPINVVHDYGAPEKEKLDLSNIFGLLSGHAKKPATSETKPQVAIVYLQGMIVDGEAKGGLFTEDSIGSDDLRKYMRIVSRDENVKAVVLRIDSPGGSALASEAMWQAVRRVAKEKPVIISVGSMAASGGYYVASAGDRIIADPSGIVGSIGVVGGKFVMKDLFEKVGIATETFSKGRNADLFSSDQPFSDSQRRLVTNWMKQTYDQFTQRVMSTRKGKIKDIDQVARGRIFTAKEALSLGMVDQLGGIEDALAAAAGDAHLSKDAYDVKILPQTRSLLDLIRGGGGDDLETKLPIRPNVTLGETSLLKSMKRTTARLIRQQMQMLQLLQDRPVILVSPYAITLK